MSERNEHQPAEHQPQAAVSAEHPKYSVEVIEQFELKYAGFWTRFWAYLIDVIVLSSISRIIVYPIFRLAGWELSSNDWYAPIAMITAIIFYAYFVLMTKFFNQTVGKMVMGIKVVPLKGEKLTWSAVLFREWIGRFIISTLWFFLYAVVAFTPKKQGLHDFIVDTTVVHDATFEKRTQKIYRKRESMSELQEPNAL